MNLQSNDFELFGIPARQQQDRAVLDQRWKELQCEVHPDRFAAHGSAAQRVAMQWSVRVNEAYQRLKDPLRRAAYLCEMHGVPVQAESNTAMPPEFLMQQMAWREALEEAERPDALEALLDEVAAAKRAWLEDCQRQLDEAQNYAAAVRCVRALMFIERFGRDIEARLDQLGQ